MNNRIFFLFFFLLSTASGLSAKGVSFTTVLPQKAKNTLFIRAQGIVTDTFKTKITSQTQGVFVQKVAQNLHVAKGQLIGIIKNPLYTLRQKNLHQTLLLQQKELQLAKQKLHNTQAMFRLSIVSHDALLDSQEQVTAKKLALTQTQNSLQSIEFFENASKIYAPHNGTLSFLAPQGTFIRRGGHIATLQYPQRSVKLFTDMRYADAITIGQKVQLHTPNGNVPAIVSTILPIAQDNLLQLIARTAKPLPLLLHVSAKISLHTLQGWTVPKRCIVLKENRAAVYVVANGVARLRFVTVLKNDTRSVLLSLNSLHKEENVVFQGAFLLHDGMQVEAAKR
jgi:hypothetical protein